MKLTSTLLLSSSLLAATAVLDARRPCVEDSCYRALWNASPDADHPLSALIDCQKYLTTTVVLYPVATTTVVCRDTYTIPGPCSSTLINPTGAIPSSSSSSGVSSSTVLTTTSTLTGFPQTTFNPTASDFITPSSLPSFLPGLPTDSFSVGDPFSTSEDSDSPTGTGVPFPTEIEEPDDPEIVTERRARRQATSTTPAAQYTIVTVTGTIPAYATAGCSVSQYPNVCLCKEVTRSVITVLGTTRTATITTTLSSFTTLSGCVSGVTSSRSSSASLTTITLTSSTGTASRSSSGTLSFTPSNASRSSGSITSSASSASISTTSSASRSSGRSTSSTTSSSVSSGSSSGTSSSVSSSSSQSVNTGTSVTITLTSTSSSTTPSGTPTCTGTGVISCQGNCTDTKSDLANCGRCGNTCNEGFECINGVCARPPCDSNCIWDRQCGPNNGTTTSNCICATEEEGHGICFDKARFPCSDARVRRCRSTSGEIGGCPVGFACIKDYCNCGGGSTLGICVSTAGCAGSEVNDLGPLVRIGEMEQRRRMVKGFGF